MLQPQNYTTIIFGSLFKPSFQSTTNIPPSTLREITLSSNAWFNHEKGCFSEDECYSRVASEFSLNKDELRRAFDQARDSLQVYDTLITLIRELKAEYDGLHVFTMSNVSVRGCEVIRAKLADCSVFDEIFASCTVGERKPNLGFYRHVLKTTGVDPGRVIFVDDLFDNVFSARSLGMHGIIFKNQEALERDLRNLLGDPVKRAGEFLRRNAGHLDCITQSTEKHTSVEVKENWSQLLILEATGDRSLVNFVEFSGKWNFFQGKAQLVIPEEFPFDTDTTSLGLTILRRDKAIAFPIMDEILRDCVNADGLILTYFDSERPRVDAGICVNVLTLFYTYGRGSEVQPVLLWVRDILLHRAYWEGTRYFNTPECFFFLITRLLACSEDPKLHEMIYPLLERRVRERVGTEGDAVTLAMRILACDFVGIRNEVDLRKLLSLQCIDGGWEIGWVYRYSLKGISVGNRGLTTALAIKAIEAGINHPSQTVRTHRFPSINPPNHPRARNIWQKLANWFRASFTT